MQLEIPWDLFHSHGRRKVDVGANSHGVVGVGGDPPPDITEYGSWRSAGHGIGSPAVCYFNG